MTNPYKLSYEELNESNGLLLAESRYYRDAYEKLVKEHEELLGIIVGAIYTADKEGLQDAWWYASARSAISESKNQ